MPRVMDDFQPVFDYLNRRRWELRYNARPWTLNNERKKDKYARAKLVKEWRAAFHWMVVEQKIPPLDVVRVTATPHLRNKRGMQDTGGCFPAVKAAIDGLVDAGVLPDDGPTHVVELTFRAPVVDGTNALVLEVEEIIV